MRLFAREAFLPDGVAPNVAIEIAPDGIISDVRSGELPGDSEVLDGAVLPGMPNLHSHAFQRAMAGHAERRGPDGDDFWSWRESMYALAATLDPERLHALALDAYRAMLRAGYTSVAEFHYLHRDPSGAWYEDRAAMAHALIAAAQEAGIAICLLPALYAHGDAGGAPLDARRRRFATTPDEVLELAETLRAAYARRDDVTVGVCAHSLRAVTPDELRALLDGSPADVPVHVHVAEQQREVQAVQAALGARPAAWLLENFELDRRWCLVHATHLDPPEIAALAASGAVAGLCPTTEANLGDGLFALAEYLHAGGALGIGSDSNVSISPVEELRWLEYGQRLSARRRVVAPTRAGASCGESLYAAAVRGGARACGRDAAGIAPGQRADLVVLAAGEGDPATLVDRYVFATDRAAPQAVYVGGRRRAVD